MNAIGPVPDRETSGSTGSPAPVAASATALTDMRSDTVEVAQWGEWTITVHVRAPMTRGVRPPTVSVTVQKEPE